MEAFDCYFHEAWLLQLFKIIISNIDISMSKITLVWWSTKPCKPKKWVFVPQIKGSTRNNVVHPCSPSWHIFNFQWVIRQLEHGPSLKYLRRRWEICKAIMCFILHSLNPIDPWDPKTFSFLNLQTSMIRISSTYGFSIHCCAKWVSKQWNRTMHHTQKYGANLINI